MTINNTLDQRGARYGKFTEHASICQDLIEIMRLSQYWPQLDSDMRQALSVIADKIARVLNGDPTYDDNWHDMQGYAKLVEDRVPNYNLSFNSTTSFNIKKKLIYRIWAAPNVKEELVPDYLLEYLEQISGYIADILSGQENNSSHWRRIREAANKAENEILGGPNITASDLHSQ